MANNTQVQSNTRLAFEPDQRLTPFQQGWNEKPAASRQLSVSKGFPFAWRSEAGSVQFESGSALGGSSNPLPSLRAAYGKNEFNCAESESG
jgi:hypothetical protein